MVGSGLWDSNQALVWQKLPKNEFCGSKSVRDRDTVIWRSELFRRLKPVYGYSESTTSIFDKMFCCCHLVGRMGRPETPFGMGLVEISEISRIYPQISIPLTMYWLVYLMVYFFSENSTEVSSCWNFNPSTRFWSQNRVKWHKNTQKCPKRSKTDEIGQNWTLWRTKTSTNLEFSWKS